MYSEIKFFLLITEIRNAAGSRDFSHTNMHLRIPLSEVGFPIRKSADQSFFAAPHGLSQRSTSFIASQRQGIRRTPLRHLIALIINVHTFSAERFCVAWFLRLSLEDRAMQETLIRKTRLLRKIGPMAMRSSVTSKIVCHAPSCDGLQRTIWR